MAVTSTSGTQAITQSAWARLQVEQARRFAERAAQNARSMQSKANDAQSAAQQAQENARALRVEANQARSIAVEADRGVRATESSSQIGPMVVNEVTQAAQSAGVVRTAAVAPAQTAPTVNTQGETIGTVVNVTA